MPLKYGMVDRGNPYCKIIEKSTQYFVQFCVHFVVISSNQQVNEK